MGVRYVNLGIKNARILAGLSQAAMSDGICTEKSLSRIETGKAGVCPSTFKLLMERANIRDEISPIFASKSDYQCYYMLHRVAYYLDSWQLSYAYAELAHIEDMHWADNCLYYQEWLMYHCRLQYLSFCSDHQVIYNYLLDALHVTKESIDFDNISNQFLTIPEIKLWIYIAQESLYINRSINFPSFYAKITEYLTTRNFTNVEIKELQSLCDIAYGKYLISICDYKAAYIHFDRARASALLDSISNCIFELTFLLGLSAFYIGQYDVTRKMFDSVFFTTHAINCCYSTVCRNYLINNTAYEIPAYWNKFDDIAFVKYPFPTEYDFTKLSDGIYSLSSSDIYTIGTIIKSTRKHLHISQDTLCKGICTKSMLSKVENNLLQPDLALTEALLQRLGISERVFNFWSSEKDALFNTYKFLCINRQRKISSKDYSDMLDKLNSQVKDSDVLYKQQYLSMTADTPDEMLNALSVTLADFDIDRITDYRLTWEELSELHILSELFRKNQLYDQSILYLRKLIEYDAQSNNDILLKHNYYPFVIANYCHSLYSSNRFSDAIKLESYCNDILFQCNPDHYSFFLFFYCQALGECNRQDEAYKYGMYTYHMQMMYGYEANAKVIENGLYNDFGINLN